MGLHPTKMLLHHEKTVSQRKRRPPEREKVFENDVYLEINIQNI